MDRIAAEPPWYFKLILALVLLAGPNFVQFAPRVGADCGCESLSGSLVRVVALAVTGIALAIWLAMYRAPKVAAYMRTARHTADARPMTPPGASSIGTIVADQWPHVHAAMVPWVMALLGVLLLTGPSQTADMLSGLKGNTLRWGMIWFSLGAGLWSLSTWFCGRWAISLAYESRAASEHWLATWSPRAMALCTGFAIVNATVNATGFCSLAATIAGATAAAVFLFAVFRRNLSARYGHWLALTAPAKWGRHAIETVARPTLARELGFAPYGPVSLALAFLASVAVLTLYAFYPNALSWLEAPGTVLTGLAALTVVATVASELWYRHVRIPWLHIPVPLLAGGLAVVALGSWLLDRPLGPDHRIRLLNEIAAPGPSLDAAAAEWLRRCGPGLIDPETGELKVVLVSTSGGASRAALWTFHALSDLEHRDPQFPRRVFSVSAVSGGALGATVWSTLLARKRFDCADVVEDPNAAAIAHAPVRMSAPPKPSSAAERRADGHAILSTDFLTPVLAAWLSRDVILGVVPIRWFLELFTSVEDRAAALERAWEQAWRARFPNEPNIMEGPFGGLWNGEMNRPILFLNGTEEGAGLPVVTSPVRLIGQDGRPNADMPGVYDARWLLSREIRVSTAALNAARFPFVSPQGDIEVMVCANGAKAGAGGCGTLQKPETPEKRVFSIVDGGYYDNIGGGTTMWAAAGLRQAFEALRMPGGPFPETTRLRIMVAAISSDPDRLQAPVIGPGPEQIVRDARVNQLGRCADSTLTLDMSKKGGASAIDAELAPVLAIVATQSGRTTARMAELRAHFCPRPGPALGAGADRTPRDYIVLSLCAIESPLSLNWVLPRETLDFFARTGLAGACANSGQLHRYATWLEGK